MPTTPADTPPLLVTLGDLVEDVVVRIAGPVNAASDTPATIERRRGGSAANVSATAAAEGTRTRFLGQVGDDAIGAALVAELAASGVDVAHVGRGGTTGTIIALVDEHGERSFLTDRRACADLAAPQPSWIDGASTLHVPLYSLADGQTAQTATTLIGWAHDAGVAVSIDLSSASVICDLGAGTVDSMLAALAPQVVFANLDEAAALGVDGPLHGAITIVKRGAEPAAIHRPDGPTAEVGPADVVAGVDTTGAGDAFAAGFLGTSTWRDDPIVAVVAGHATAARLLATRITTLER